MRVKSIFLLVAFSIVLTVGFLVVPVLAKEKPVVAYLLPNVGPWYTDKWFGVKNEAEKLGIDVTLYSAGGYANIDKQIRQMENLIEKRVDGIILHPTSSTALIPVTKKALKAGIPVTTEHCPLKGIVSRCHVWEATPEAGWLMGALLTLEIGGEGKIAALPGPPGQDEAMMLWKGFTEYIANFPGIKIVKVEWADVNIAKSLKLAENFLTAYPDVDAIYTWFEIEAQGAIQALKARGYKPGQVKIITAWVSKETLKLVKEGWIQYILPGSAVEVGRTSARIMKKLLEGKEVPREVSVPMIAVGKDEIDKWDRSKWEAPK